MNERRRHTSTTKKELKAEIERLRAKLDETERMLRSFTDPPRTVRRGVPSLLVVKVYRDPGRGVDTIEAVAYHENERRALRQDVTDLYPLDSAWADVLRSLPSGGALL